MNLAFFKSPHFQLESDNSFIQKIKELFKTILWMYGIIFICTLFLKIIDFFVYKSTNFSFYDIIFSQQNKNFGKYPIYYLLILAPFIEELLFRLPLSLKKIHLFFSLFSYSLYILFFTLLSGKLLNTNIYFKIFFFLFISLLIYFLINQSKFDFIKKKYYPIYFYLLCIIFGLIHLFNFYKVVPNNLLFIAPLFILPQIILGCFAGYLRLKNGFLWGFVLHIIFNIPGALLLYSK
jgi:membrane protease YdiL (CAAX protease family)